MNDPKIWITISRICPPVHKNDGPEPGEIWEAAYTPEETKSEEKRPAIESPSPVTKERLG